MIDCCHQLTENVMNDSGPTAPPTRHLPPRGRGGAGGAPAAWCGWEEVLVSQSNFDEFSNYHAALRCDAIALNFAVLHSALLHLPQALIIRSRK